MAVFTSQPSHISPLDLIFSCTVCQDTLSSVYAVLDNVGGLRRDNDSSTSIVPRLWLTECAHVTCGKHFEGGGPPFHPESEQPRAPCPHCKAEKGDDAEKALFAIHGRSPGEYDKNIPDAYFKIPPVKLTGDDPGLEAMRFQYLSLLRYGTKKEARCKAMRQEMDKLHQAASGYATTLDTLQKEKVALGKENLELRENIQIWENRRPELIRFMRALPLLVQELKKSRKSLHNLGQDVASIDNILHPYEQEGADSTNTGMLANNVEYDRDTSALQAQGMSSSRTNDNAGLGHGSGNEIARRSTPMNGSTTSVRNGTAGPSRLAQGSAADLDMLSSHGIGLQEDSEPNPFDSLEYRQPAPNNISSAKRKRVSTPDIGEGQNEYKQARSEPQRVASRDLMPPPAVPFRNGGAQLSTMSDVDAQPYRTRLRRDNVRSNDYQSSNNFVTNAYTDEAAAFRWHNGHERYTDSNFSLYGDQPDHRLSDAPISLPQARQSYDQDANSIFYYDQPTALAYAKSRPPNGTHTDTSSNQPYITPIRTPSRASAPATISRNSRETFNLGPFYYSPKNSQNTKSRHPLNDGEIDQYRITTQPYPQPPATSPVRNRMTLPPRTPRLSRNGISPSRHSGMFAGVRTSNPNLNSIPNPPTTPRPHREPLTMRNTDPSNPVQQSPFFAARTLPDRENLFSAPQQGQWRRGQTARQVMNRLSFMREPAVPNSAGNRGIYSAGGRRRARR